MIYEVLIGIGLALVVFGIYQGVNLFPFLLLGGLVYFIFYMNGSARFSKQFAQITSETGMKRTTFNDVGGQSSAKKELLEALDFIADSEKVASMGIRPLKGILLTGPPGTGKTLLARAAANYTDSAFIAASGSEFIEVYAGVGAQRIRSLFSQAKSQARKLNKTTAIIFIDELEILGGRRGRQSSHLEYDQTLNQLLVEMDGISVDDHVRILVIGATNRIDMLDPAILRPGRFDRVVNVDLPDRGARLEILKLHSKGKPLGSDVDLNKVARETFGFSGAHLESLCNEAAILAFREGEQVISGRHFLEAVDKVMMGEKLDRKPNGEQLKRVAVHEVGHALLSEMLREDSVSSITIMPRGSALGYMRNAPGDDVYLETKEYLEEEIAILLAGSVSEELNLGSRSTGAANDFERAVDTAKRMIFSGMSELGVISQEDIPRSELYREVSKIMKAAETTVKEVITQHRKVVDETVAHLLKEERISGDEFRQMIKGSRGQGLRSGRKKPVRPRSISA